MKMQNLINSIEMRIFCLWSRIFPGKIYYINGPETLPPPLTKEEEKKAFRGFNLNRNHRAYQGRQHV